ncbi:hypothetical protein Tco_0277729 [Tanacetum coccineum]
MKIERLLRVVVSQDIMSIMQNLTVVETSDLQTELDRTKERFENYIIKKENEYAKLWNEIAQLGDLKGKSKDTPCVSDTLDPLSQKLKNENVELKFQVLNYAKENAHLETTYKNLFDSISVTHTQTKTIINSLQNKLHDTIYENAKLRAQLFDKVPEQKDITKGTSVNTQFCKQSILGKTPYSSSGTKIYSVTPFPKSNGLPKINESHALSKPITSKSVPTTTETNVVKNDKVIAPRMFRINPSKASWEDKFVPINKVRASVRTNQITVSQPNIITKKHVNSDSNGLSSTGIDNIKTRRPQPRSNTKNDRCFKDEVEMVRQWRRIGFERLGGASMISLRKGFDVPTVDDVSLVDRVFDGAFCGDGEEDFVMREGVVVSSSSLDMFTKSYLGEMMVSLNFLEGLEEEAWVESMEVEEK